MWTPPSSHPENEVTPLTWDREHSGCSPGTGSVQVVFMLCLGPAAHLLRQTSSSSLSQNKLPIHPKASIDKRGASRALIPGRALGRGRLDLPSSSAPGQCPPHSQPLPCLIRFLRQVTGESFKPRTPWITARTERMGPGAYPWMDPLDTPSGTDDQTENGTRWRRVEAHRDYPGRAQTHKLFFFLLRD